MNILCLTSVIVPTGQTIVTKNAHWYSGVHKLTFSLHFDGQVSLFLDIFDTAQPLPQPNSTQLQLGVRQGN